MAFCTTFAAGVLDRGGRCFNSKESMLIAAAAGGPFGKAVSRNLNASAKLWAAWAKGLDDLVLVAMGDLACVWVAQLAASCCIPRARGIG